MAARARWRWQTVTISSRRAFLLKVRFRRSASDAQLLAGASSDPEAFTTFYERYEAAVLGYFVRRTRDPELAADLAAEVFAAAFQAAGRYQPVAASAAGWLFTIASNTLVSSVRRGRVEEAARRQIGMLDAVELHDDHLERVQRELMDEAWASELLARLPEDQRDAVRARVLDELPYEEIAARLQTSSLVVRKRVSRGLLRLRTELEQHP
jgi:RNA polymerase sigma-70 factor (ECF subfamily)